VPSTSTRASRSSRATKRSSASDDRSAQCRSSRTSSSGSVSPARLSSPATASKRRKRAWSGSRAGLGGSSPSLPASPGTSRATSAAPSPSSARRVAGSRRPAWSRSAWIHGQKAGAPSPSQQVPQRTPAPSDSARTASSSARRVLPMPGSPATSTSDPRPVVAPTRLSHSSSRSRWRPTKVPRRCPIAPFSRGGARSGSTGSRTLPAPTRYGATTAWSEQGTALGGRGTDQPGAEPVACSCGRHSGVPARPEQEESVREQPVVVALGGNAISPPGSRSPIPAQYELTLDTCVADTQGGMGFMLQQCLENAFGQVGRRRPTVTVVTRTVVELDDPAFRNPSKPIGNFYEEPEARQRMAADGWAMREDAGGGWRRVVPSPAPKEIVEERAIRALLDTGAIVIAAGGGGVPVVRQADGSLLGVEAVIDKDLASALLAANLGAEVLLVLTGVEHVALDFGRPTQRDLHEVRVGELAGHAGAGQFAAGSMLPKVQAAIGFLARGGKRAVITTAELSEKALAGEIGTQVVP